MSRGAAAENEIVYSLARREIICIKYVLKCVIIVQYSNKLTFLQKLFQLTMAIRSLTRTKEVIYKVFSI